MKPHDLEAMSVEDLSLHEFVASVLTRRISAEKPGLMNDYASSTWVV